MVPPSLVKVIRGGLVAVTALAWIGLSPIRSSAVTALIEAVFLI